jgi:hypothetical protein
MRQANGRRGSNLAARSRSREWPESARSRHRANQTLIGSTQLDPFDFAFGESRLRVISGGAGPSAARQVNLKKRTPQLDRADLKLRNLLAG